jgi:hypothetical protein
VEALLVLSRWMNIAWARQKLRAAERPKVTHAATCGASHTVVRKPTRTVTSATRTPRRWTKGV